MVDFYFRHDSSHRVVAHTVTSESLTTTDFFGVPVVPFEEIAERYPPDECGFFVAIGYSRVNRNRREIFEKARALGYRMVGYVC